MTRMGLLILAIAAVTAAGKLGADTLIMFDGQVIHGKLLTPEDAPLVKMDTPLGPLEVQRILVKEIKLDGFTTTMPDAATAAAGPKIDLGLPQTQPADSALAGLVGKVDPALLAKFAESAKAADKATTGAEGLAVWDAFLKDCATPALADEARKRQAVWKDRAAKNQAKFGPTKWLPKDQVDAHKAKAEELLAKAEAETKADDAARLYEQAATEDPNRIDIPLKKALRMYKDKKVCPEFGKALGEVVKLDPNNVTALNNLGVMQALQKQWIRAMGTIGHAAIFSDNDKLLDNLDQVGVMAAAEDNGPARLSPADGEKAVQIVVAQLHNLKKHLGENRWGNTWIKQEDYDKNLKANSDVDQQEATARANISNLNKQEAPLLVMKKKYDDAVANAQKTGSSSPGATGVGTVPVIPAARGMDAFVAGQKKYADLVAPLDAQIAKAQDDLKALEAKRVAVPHAGKLVLLDADGQAELASVDPTPTAPVAPPAGKAAGKGK